MKRIIQLILCILLLCVIIDSASAANAKYENAMELYRAWVAADAVPEFVCGAWSTGGVNMAFGIVDDENYQKNVQTVKNQLDHHAALTFVRMNPEDAYLYGIFYEVQNLYEMDIGLVSVGVGDGVVHMEFVDSFMSNHATQKEIQKLRGAYGEAVEYVFIGSAYVPAPEEESPIPQIQSHDGSMDLVWIFTAITLCSAVVMVVFTWRRRTPQYLVMGKYQLESDPSKPVSMWALKAGLQHSAPEVPSSLDERVLNSIRELTSENNS